MSAFKYLLTAFLLASGCQALAGGPHNICTTLATDKSGSLKVGYLSDGTEISTQNFALQYRDGKTLEFPSSSVCYPRVRTIAQDVFLVSVENCGSAFLPEYRLVRADPITGRVRLLDYLSPDRFYAAELKEDRWAPGGLQVRLLYAAQYKYPFQPSKISMVVSPRGFQFGRQMRNAPLRDADYRLSQGVLQDVYDAGFEPERIGKQPCGPFSKQTRMEAARNDVDICGKRREIAAAIRYLKAAPARRLAAQENLGRLSPALCNSRIDSDNPYATGWEEAIRGIGNQGASLRHRNPRREAARP